MKGKRFQDASRRTGHSAIAPKRAPHYLLRLYVTGVTPQSTRAILNMKTICEEHLKGRYSLEVIDVYQQPEVAKQEQTGHDYAQRIIAASSRMDQLIRDLLTFGRLSSADLPLVEVDSEKIIESVVDQISASKENKHATIAIQKPLPNVWANPAALEQVLQNLLSNAIKFVAPEVKPKIQVWAEEHSEKARLYIKDNGIGIEPKYHERVFHVFERISARDYPGTGIGLAIVQKAVERMGGRVGLQSEPGKGSCFWLELRKATTSNGE